MQLKKIAAEHEAEHQEKLKKTREDEVARLKAIAGSQSSVGNSTPPSTKATGAFEIYDNVTGPILKDVADDYIDMIESDTNVIFSQEQRDMITSSLRVNHAIQNSGASANAGYSIYAPQGRINVDGKIIVPISNNQILPSGMRPAQIGSRFIIFEATQPLNPAEIKFLNWCEDGAKYALSRSGGLVSLGTFTKAPPHMKMGIAAAFVVLFYKYTQEVFNTQPSNTNQKTKIGWEEISFAPRNQRPIAPIVNPTGHLTTPIVKPSDPSPLITPISAPIDSGILPGRQIDDPNIRHGNFLPGYHAHRGKIDPLTIKSSPYKPKDISAKVFHKRFGVFHQEDGSNVWITKDKSRHGGSAWKVYEKKGDKLIWTHDADKDLTPIPNKHKSLVGKEIPIKEFNGVSGFKGI